MTGTSFIDFRYKKDRWGRNIVLALAHIMMAIYVVLIFYPLFNMLISSLKSTREIFSNPFGFPEEWLFDNYITVWVVRGFGRYFINSVSVTFFSMAFVLLLGSMASYGVSRYKYKLRTWIYMLFLSGIMLPLKMAIIPLFLIIRNMGLMDNHISIIMIFIAMGLPSTVFILSGFMKTIPMDLEYAARIDGCNEWGIYRRIVMPITKSAIALVTIYNAVPIWNDFFFPLVFIQSNRLRTLPVGLSTFIGQHGTNWSLLFTGLSISIMPMLFLYIFMSRYFIRGMTAGAIK